MSSIAKVANKDARTYVDNRAEFTGSHTMARWQGDVYVVYSYGTHFPMYVYDSLSNTWFGNYDKYSVSTSKHQSQLRPSGDVIYRNTELLKNIIYSGVAAALAN